MFSKLKPNSGEQIKFASFFNTLEWTVRTFCYNHIMSEPGGAEFEQNGNAQKIELYKNPNYVSLYRLGSR